MISKSQVCSKILKESRLLRVCHNLIKREFSTCPESTSDAEQKYKDLGRTKKEILEFLGQMNMVHSEKHACIMTTCLRNSKSRTRFDKLDKLYINSTTGYFACHGCHKTGPWSKFKENTLKVHDNLCKKRIPSCFDKDEDVKSIMDSTSFVEACNIFEESLPINSCDIEKLTTLLEDFNIEGIKVSTLEKYQVRIKSDYSGLVFPLIGLKNKVMGVKVVSYPPKTEDEHALLQHKFDVKLYLGEDLHGLFGFNLIQPTTTEVVLASSELDALVLYQETGKVAMCIPKEEPILPQEVLPLLEPISKITLWMGGDILRWDDIKHFGVKLGEARCHLIRPDATRPVALEALKRSLDLKKILDSSVSMKHKCITTILDSIEELRNKIYDSDEATGVKWQRFPKLNQLLKGHRRGELTVLTGSTGCGKTTFVSEYSLDLAMQGVKTLWGSFEINNIRLMEIMLAQYSQLDLASNSDKFDHFVKCFAELPMYFMTFHGEECIDKVIEVMTHAVYVHDIAHVVVDNLQFMMGVSDSKNYDKYLKQDVIISAFRKFATKSNCHITLIVHPRKEPTELLTLSSVFGSAKATQEADNVLLLQSTGAVTGRGKKFIQVAKNRYAGDLGNMPLKFNKECLSFSIKSKDKSSESSGLEEEFNEDNSDFSDFDEST